MKYCMHCGKELSDDAHFCSECGTAVETIMEPATVNALTEEEQKCLDNFYRFFKYERLAWKIPGIIILIFSIFFFAFSFLFMMIGVTTEEILIGVALPFFLYGILFLPLAIVCLKMVGKAEHYMDIIYKDVRPVIKRCNSVGMIVFSALFNNIAMAFIIVNFVFAKTKATLLDGIVQKQETNGF